MNTSLHAQALVNLGEAKPKAGRRQRIAPTLESQERERQALVAWLSPPPPPDWVPGMPRLWECFLDEF